MKKLIIASSILHFIIVNSYSQITPLFGRFVGSSPCGNAIRSLLKMPTDTACDFMKWNLMLYQDPTTQQPTKFKLSVSYGVYQNNTSNFAGGGSQFETEGKWAIGKGTKTNPEAIIYQLNPDQAEKSMSFVKMDDNVIHLLYNDGSLMIGNAGHSYTFNKAK
ncbi:MAG: hypothetical protein R2822_22350 [Spirosomataceae bacterium]